MKTTFFASCALAAITVCSSAVANDVFVGGNVEFKVGSGENIEDVASNNLTTFFNYAGDAVTDFDTAFVTNADVTFKTNTKTRVLEYGAYVNIDMDNIQSSANSITDIDAHIRVRMAHGTFKFGTDIDGLQGAEDLDWVTVGPESFSNAIVAPMASHAFTQGVSENGGALGDSSITFTTNTINGFTAAAEVTPDSVNDEIDWGASLKYSGQIVPGAMLTAVVATESSEAVLANAKMTLGDVTAGAMYGKDMDNDEYMGGALAYDLGALTLSGGYMAKEGRNSVATEVAKQEDVTIGVAYELAPGLTLDGNVLRNKRNAYTSSLEANRYVGRIKLKF